VATLPVLVALVGHQRIHPSVAPASPIVAGVDQAQTMEIGAVAVLVLVLVQVVRQVSPIEALLVVEANGVELERVAPVLQVL
tara:strand:- start:460 stop:705 length:246 start_codon:yes stop_codon:yes gene_type:complete